MTIPYLKWDYDDRKQAMVMEVLKAREAATGGNLGGEEEDPELLKTEETPDESEVTV